MDPLEKILGLPPCSSFLGSKEMHLINKYIIICWRLGPLGKAQIGAHVGSPLSQSLQLCVLLYIDTVREIHIVPTLAISLLISHLALNCPRVPSPNP